MRRGGEGGDGVEKGFFLGEKGNGGLCIHSRLGNWGDASCIACRDLIG